MSRFPGFSFRALPSWPKRSVDRLLRLTGSADAGRLQRDAKLVLRAVTGRRHRLADLQQPTESISRVRWEAHDAPVREQHAIHVPAWPVEQLLHLSTGADLG